MTDHATQPGAADAMDRFGAALGGVFAELDWELLGQAACEGDGATFYDDGLRERIVDSGLRFVDELADAFARGGGEQQRSLYLGAEVAELPMMFAEHLVLGREVHWRNVAGAATDELARAVRVSEERLDLTLPRPSTEDVSRIAPRSCDHLWMVSVLTDPDAFPALHDALYERTGGPLATGRGDLEEDRARAAALIEVWLDRAAPRCVLATTDEERELIAPEVIRRGRRLRFARDGRLSAVVGDRVRIGVLDPPEGSAG